MRFTQRGFVAVGLILALMAVSGCAALDTTATSDSDFTSRFYGGGGVLVSQVEPDTDSVPGTSVDDSMSAGASLTLGYDINSRFSVEGHLADLGDATLDPAGSIGYRVGGVSGVIYGLNEELDRSRRTGFSVFGKLGIGMMSNDAQVVDFRRVNDVHLLAGLGLEYGLNNGLGLRAELVAHETDAKFAQLGVIYRFGGSRDRGSVPAGSVNSAAEDSTAVEADVDDATVSLPVDDAADQASDAVVATPEPATPATAPAAPAAPAPAPAPVTPEPAAPVTSDSDEDADGVPASEDQCPDTEPGVPVTADGCVVFGGVIEGITFEIDSDTLTPGALVVLDGVAKTLMEYPDIRVTVEAHTDNLGNAAANLQLSKRRALAVARYLVDQGISGTRLKPQAFGESRPRTSNLTRQGRAANRRVEFALQK